MKRLLNGFPLAGLAGLAVVALALAACDITSLNENPNAASTVTTANLLANTQNDLATNQNGGFTLGRFANLYAQYWTQNQYTDEDRYAYPSKRSGSLGAMWNSYYLILNDLQEVIRINREGGDGAVGFGSTNNQIAVAMIMQAYTYHLMTDIWGPIPFEEALQGRDQGNFTPSYTDQETIYRSLIDSLTQASSMIDASGSAFGSSDLVYGGDMSKWKKLANSLKMRVGIRAAETAPDLAEQAISEAEGNAFNEVSDAATIPFSGSPPNQSPIYENYNVANRDDWAVTEALIGTMNDLEDPRRPAYATDVDGEYLPCTYGNTPSMAINCYGGPFSRPSTYVQEADAPAQMMLYDEVLFTKAEAAERGFIDGDPAQLYRDAIDASIQYWSNYSGGAVDVEATDDYIDGVPYDNSNGWAPEGDAETWRQTLGTQKWLALYNQGVQGWSAFRRIGFDGILIPPPGNPAVNGLGLDVSIPVRLPYPNGEATLNAAARDSAVAQLGADTQGIRLWWDTTVPSD